MLRSGKFLLSVFIWYFVLKPYASKYKEAIATEYVTTWDCGLFQVAVPSQSELYEALKPLDDSCYRSTKPIPQDTDVTKYIPLKNTDLRNFAISVRSAKVVLQFLSDGSIAEFGSRLHYSIIQEGIPGGYRSIEWCFVLTDWLINVDWLIHWLIDLYKGRKQKLIWFVLVPLVVTGQI